MYLYFIWALKKRTIMVHRFNKHQYARGYDRGNGALSTSCQTRFALSKTGANLSGYLDEFVSDFDKSMVSLCKDSMMEENTKEQKKEDTKRKDAKEAP